LSRLKTNVSRALLHNRQAVAVVTRIKHVRQSLDRTGPALLAVAAGQHAQQTAADLGLDLVEQLLVGGTAFVKRRRS
jgi:hypothetical protein